ncbi:MAG: hypothetical protein M3Q08_01670 [Pseudomonadota bacterium]|nr:hypothetical protein [Pseudomonadota bacterium]
MATKLNTNGSASALPTSSCNVIPFRRRERRMELAAPLPDESMKPSQYARAWTTLCCQAEEAVAYRQYVEARWLVLSHTDPAEAERYNSEREPAFQRMLAFVNLVASFPVPRNRAPMTASHIARKKRIIGPVWLRAEGPRYAAYRASVAADEAMLALRN